MKIISAGKINFVILFVLLSCMQVSAQNKWMEGKVFSTEDTLGLPGVAISLKGKTTGTLSDINGYFKLEVPDNTDSLVFILISYKKKTVAVTNTNFLKVLLETENHSLDEVVVTALGVKREKKALGYAMQEVGGAELQTAKDPSFINQLSGKVAGLNISSTTGGLGSSSRIVLRGATSLGGNNQALIVVDGVPIENNTNNSTSQWGGFDYGNGISDINSDDIESISVLKGPAAAALYGSRAANGVILISTKKGKAKSAFRVSFNSTTTAEVPYILTKFQNTYGAGRNGKFEGPWELKNGYTTYNPQSADAFGSWGPKMEGQTIRDWDGQVRSFSPQANNYRDYFKTGFSSSNAVSIDGGGDKAGIRFSAANVSSSDIVPNSSLNRTNINLNTVASLSEKISFDASIMYTDQQVKNRLPLSNDFSAPRNYIMMPRNISDESLQSGMMDASGKEMTWYSNWNWMSNPYWYYKNELNDDRRSRVLGIISLTYKISPKLSAMIRSNTDFNTSRFNKRDAYNGIINRSGSYNNTWKNYRQYQSEFLISFHDSIGKDITYTANLGGSSFQNRDESTYLSTSGGLSVPYFYNVQYSVNPVNTAYGLYEKRVNGLYTFAQIAYKSWLFTDITARNDWSSTLPAAHRSYFYPSISTSFIYTEAFHIPQRIFSYGKIRMSLAKVGRDTDPYRLQNTYAQTQTFNGAPMASVNSVIPPANLKPETTNNVEFGSEMIFFNGRIGIDFTWYQLLTKNQILTSDISSASGYPQALVNSGEIRNRGIELMLKTKPISSKNFSWDLNVNFAKNNSMVLSLAPGINNYVIYNHWRLNIEARPGMPYGLIVGYGIKRDANGNKLVDDKGMYIRDTTMSVLGNYNPKFTLGMNNNFRYKNLVLSVLVDSKIGGKMFSGTNMYGTGYSGNLVETLEGRDAWYASEQQREAAGISPENWAATGGLMANGVKADGSTNKVYVNPQEYWGQFSKWEKEIHEPFIYDATYVKLREITLIYTFNEKVFKKLKLKGLSAGLTARNLWLIYSGIPNIDPESAYSNGNNQGLELYAYPSRRSIGFNLKLTL